jgi:hypothetical protein
MALFPRGEVIMATCCMCGCETRPDEYGICDECYKAPSSEPNTLRDPPMESKPDSWDDSKDDERKENNPYDPWNEYKPQVKVVFYPKSLFSFKVWESAIEKRLNMRLDWFGRRYMLTFKR